MPRGRSGHQEGQNDPSVHFQDGAFGHLDHFIGSAT